MQGQFSKKYQAQKHWMPLKSIPPKESQIWFIGKEIPQWWDLVAATRDHHHSQLLSQNHLLLPRMSLELFSISTPVLTSPTSIFPVLAPSQGLDFPHKSLTSTSHNSVFCDTFCSISLLRAGTLWQSGAVLWGSVALQVCRTRHLPSAKTPGWQKHLAGKHKPQGVQRSPALSRPSLTYRKWRITHRLLHMLYCS